MAALSLKERELDSRLVETRQFSERLSRLVIRVICGFMQQTQELSLIKFLLTAILFGAGRDPGSGGSDGPDVPPLIYLLYLPVRPRRIGGNTSGKEGRRFGVKFESGAGCAVSSKLIYLEGVDSR